MQLTPSNLWRANLGDFFVARLVDHADALCASHGFGAFAINLVSCTGDDGNACCGEDKYVGEHHDDWCWCFFNAKVK